SGVNYYATDRIGSHVVEYPFRVGHESAGVVEAVGPAVTQVKTGDRIAVEPAISCFECDQCKAGRPHTCRNLLFLGCPGQVDGCLSEFIVMPQQSCFPIKDSMSFEQAALSEPLAIGWYAVKNSLPVEGKAIGILGVGPIGLSVLLSALKQGADRVYVTDKINGRLEHAKNAGAVWGGNPDEDDIVQAIHSEEPGQLDIVFECCGQQDALDQAIELLKPGGTLVIVGIPEGDKVSFSIDKMRHKEITIRNVRRQVHCVQESLNMIDNKCIDVDFMVTHRFSLEDSVKAFDLVDKYEDGVVKAMVNI
ncbi:hypothetical protein BVX97_00630, partial [bacterium E08(2017)]